MSRLVAMLLLVAAALPARAALVLEFIQVAAINAPQSADPAATSLVLFVGHTAFVQVALRDTLGSGPEYGQPGTVAWYTGPIYGSPNHIGLGTFFLRFDSDAGTQAGLANNPSPTSSANARLVNTVGAYASVNSGTNPPIFTRFGGLINGGFANDPTTVPDPVTHRISLFNLKIVAGSVGGSGVFHLKDPNPTPASADNAILGYYNSQNGDLYSIDAMLFGSNFLGTYDLPYTVVVPEPSALALAALAGAWLGRRYRFGFRTTIRPARDLH